MTVFFRSRCSMEMWCLYDIGRESWDWVGLPAWERTCFNSPEWCGGSSLVQTEPPQIVFIVVIVLEMTITHPHPHDPAKGFICMHTTGGLTPGRNSRRQRQNDRCNCSPHIVQQQQQRPARAWNWLQPLPPPNLQKRPHNRRKCFCII